MIEVLIWAVVALITQFSKRREIDQKYGVLVVSFVWGFLWFLLGTDMQEMFAEVWLQIVGSATVIYNVIKLSLHE